jgi:transposase
MFDFTASHFFLKQNTMRGKRLSDDLVRVIYRKHDDGLSLRKIAEDLSISVHAAHSALHRRVPHSMQQQKKELGRPRVTTSETDRHIRLSMKRERFRSTTSLAREFGVSRWTINRRGKETGISSRLAVRDYLTQRHKIARRNWCRSHYHTDFSAWLFSDESSFELADCSAQRRAFVHRRSNEKFAPCCVLPVSTNNRQKLMIWGCIASNGDKTLCFIDGNITATHYTSMLEANLVPFLEHLPLSIYRRHVFQQDNASPHSAAHTRQFLQVAGINTVPWPALSPDLNPIENIWGLMKGYIRKHGNVTNLHTLRQSITKAWDHVVTPEMCRRLYSSMPTRIHKVLAHRGVR